MQQVETALATDVRVVETPKRERPGHALAATRRQRVALALITGDVVTMTIVAGMLKFFAVATESGQHVGGLAILTSLLGLIAALASFGLYGSEHAEPIERLRRRGLATIVAAAGLIGWAAATGAARELWIFIVVGGAMNVVLGYYVEALARTHLIRLGLWGAPTVVFGRPAACAELASSLAARPDLGLTPIAVVQDHRFGSTGQPIAGLPVISDDQAEILSSRVEVAICASDDLSAEKPGWLSRVPVRQVFLVHDVSALETLHVRTRALGGLLGLELRSAIHLRSSLVLKRLLDLAIAIPAGIVALPVIGLLAFVIKLVDGGPAFYSQVRVGRNGRAFRLYKLRSMYEDAEQRLEAHLASDPAARHEWERFFKLTDDPRILPVIGNLIRRSSLDELPQLWNVVRGDMSAVGPRPFPDYHSRQFDIEFQALRASVPPGLTGLWQISARSDGDLSVQKYQDSFYIRNWSVWMDLYILLQTVPALLTARGAR